MLWQILCEADWEQFGGKGMANSAIKLINSPVALFCVDYLISPSQTITTDILLNLVQELYRGCHCCGKFLNLQVV